MINANEQQVINAASGTFEYEGKTYRAKASYISELTAKMDQEGVDLTASDANAAIRQIMANVGTGVRQGYLEEVEKKETGKPSQSKKDKDGGKNNVSPSPKANHAAEAGGSAGQTGETAAAATEVEDAPSQTPAQAEMGTPTGGAVSTEGTGGEVLQVSPEPLQIDVQAASDAREVRQFTANSETAVQTGRAFGHYEVAAVVVWLLCVAASTVFLKKIKRRKKMCAGLAGIFLTGASIILVGVGYLFWSEAFSGSRWKQVVTESAYLNEASRDVAASLKREIVCAGLPETVLDEFADENAVYRDAKILVCADEDVRAEVLERARSMLGQALAAQPGISGQQQAELSDVLVQQYGEGLTIPWLTYLQGKRETGRKVAWVFWISGMVCMVAGACVLFFKTKYVHRAFRGIAMGCLSAGAGFILSGVFGRFAGAELSIEPDSYGRLITMYVQSVCRSGGYFGILAVCVGLAFAMLSYFMKTRIE